MADEKEVPLDVVEQILIQMDVEDLLRWKTVCKSWKSLISTPRFVKAHLNHSYLKDRDSHEFGERRIYTLQVPVVSINDVNVIVGSCNGLVCVSRIGSDAFVVANPSTREVKKLQTLMYPRRTSICWGFGYDSAIDDYKVVVGFRTDKSTTLFHVLTLKSNTWKVIGNTVDYESVWDRTGGIFCDGALHWFIVDAMRNKVIISLDLSTHEFKEILLPTEYDAYREYKLGIREECLCMYRSWNPTGKIWVMRSKKWKVYDDIHQQSSSKYEYDVVHFLTKLYRPDDYTTSETTSYVFGVDDGRLVPGAGCGNIFVKSLVSPDNNYAKQKWLEDNGSVESRA